MVSQINNIQAVNSIYTAFNADFSALPPSTNVGIILYEFLEKHKNVFSSNPGKTK